MKFCEISKEVGWEHRDIKYPSLIEVQDALRQKYMKQLLIWQRFLPSPDNIIHKKIIDMICDGFYNLRERMDES